MRFRFRRMMSTRLVVCIAVLVAAAIGYVSLQSYAAKVSRDLRAQARAIAGDQPFCVQVPKAEQRSGRVEEAYRPVRDVNDTWGLRMRGHGGHHHAVLIVGDGTSPQTFHWSYVNDGFVKGTYGPFPIVCRPSRNYFESANSSTPDDTYRFLLDGMRFVIPWRYQPEAHWPGDMIGYSVRARAPYFAPESPNCSAPACETVFVAVERDGKPYGMRADLSGRTLDEQTVFAGLRRVQYPRSTTDDYLQIDSHGKVVTEISCIVGCLHRFSHAGFTFSFHHRREHLPGWRGMQDRLIDLHAAFTGPPFASAPRERPGGDKP